MNKSCVLFEHETKRVLDFAGTREENDRRFLEIENYLIGISKSKPVYPFFQPNKEKDDQSENRQRILELNYRDYSLSANQFIGVIQMRWCRFTILPKIFAKLETESEESLINKASHDLMYFLDYAYDLKNNKTSNADFSKNKNLDFLEIFIELFATETLKVLERNIYHSYETLEENLGFVKGKILFQQHFKDNTIKKRNDRIYCRYMLFQEDNLLNQMIKYVARLLFRKSRMESNKSLLRKILHILSDIDNRTFVASDTEKIILNSTQKEFVPIVNYCKLFLENSLVKFNQNNVNIFCFLIDMNALFEKFVAGFLKKHFKDWKIEPQKSDKYVAETNEREKIFQMKHDIFLTKDDTSIILDTKYKTTDFFDKKGGISQSDVYQMTTYAIRRKCKNVILLYPKYCGDNSGERMDYDIVDEFSGDKIHLTAFKLDLTSMPSEKTEKDNNIKKQLADCLKII